MTSYLNMRLPRTALQLLAAGLVAGVAAMPASAVTLTTASPPASFADTALPGTTAALRPELAGTVLTDQITPFSFQGLEGTVQSRVVRESSSGTLDFYWRLTVSRDASGVGLSAFRLVDFGATQLVDADWRMDGLGQVSPSTARLFSVSTQPSGAINFLFDTPIPAGSGSTFFFLKTTATDYAATGRFDLLTGGAQNLSPIYGTLAPVPEPTAWALGLVGCVVAAAARRRQQRT